MIEAWPQSVKTTVDLTLGSGHAMQLVWDLDALAPAAAAGRERLRPVRHSGAPGSDLLERSQTEAALRESEDWQVFLLKLSDALRPLSNPVALQDAACAHVPERTTKEADGRSQRAYNCGAEYGRTPV